MSSLSLGLLKEYTKSFDLKKSERERFAFSVAAKADTLILFIFLK
jgi:hypothetical protein